MKVKPLGNRILVKKEAAETKTASGLYIPEAAQEKTQTAIVIAIGTDDISVKINDKIIFNKFSGTIIKIDGEEFLILKIDDVIAVIQES